MKQMVLLIFGVLFWSCTAQKDIEKVDFLIGNWQIENKTTFESWKKEGNILYGYSYKYIEGEKRITETLSIEQKEDSVVYTAQVNDQNQGKPIPFILNINVQDKLSFENSNHDFPKKIQYQKINESKIYVSVLGEEDKGFSYFLIKK